MRQSNQLRETKETQIDLSINLDGEGNCQLDLPIQFFGHMLKTWSKYALVNLNLSAKGDIEVDQHHLIEDLGIVLGKAIYEALGTKQGINRTAYFVFPMDEALALVAIDLGGRPYLQYDVTFTRRFCGDFDLDVLEDFFQALTMNMKANVVIRAPFGRSDHHKVEAIFKALGKAFRFAISKDPRLKDAIPSTKGVLE